MPRFFTLNDDARYISDIPCFVEFSGFDSYLERFGLSRYAYVPVWRLADLLNPDGSLDLCLIARPAGWFSFMVDYWTNRLLNILQEDM